MRMGNVTQEYIDQHFSGHGHLIYSDVHKPRKLS